MTNEFILNQQLPHPVEALRRAEASLLEQAQQQDSPTPSQSKTTCPHLLEFLPDQLDLSFSKITSTSSTGSSWILNNPIHALHLQAIWDPREPNEASTKQQQHPTREPVLLGEEQERFMAFQTEGIPDMWHPWIVPSPPPPPPEVVPSLPPPPSTSALAPTENPSNPAVATTTSTSSTTLPDQRYWQLHHQEEQIHLARRALFSKRAAATNTTTTSTTFLPNPWHPSSTSSSMLSRMQQHNNPNSHRLLPTSGVHTGISHTDGTTAAQQQEQQPQLEQLAQWDHLHMTAKQQVDLWLCYYRRARTHTPSSHVPVPKTTPKSFFQQAPPPQPSHPCRKCREKPTSNNVDEEATQDLTKTTTMMQCLECSHRACAAEHMLEHWLVSQHRFAATCEPQPQVYCFHCGDYVRHEIFDHEQERLELIEEFPWMGWNEHAVQRSFDALRFMRTLDHGIVWRGMKATYPPMVPLEHLQAARWMQWRKHLLEGTVDEAMLQACGHAAVKEFCGSQRSKAPSEQYHIAAPVGMYNLGNTCFMSAILQCLIHCQPVQKYFLNEHGHHHLSCEVYRRVMVSSKYPTTKRAEDSKNKAAPVVEVCLACELDRVFLQYLGNTIGVDLPSLVADCPMWPSGEIMGSSSSTSSSSFHSPNENNNSQHNADTATMGNNSVHTPNCAAIPVTKGDPLVTADVLTAAWKCGGMNHLAGYEQRDAHEFLHGFLEILGKHTRRHRERAYQTINIPRPSNSYVSSLKGAEQDVIKRLFQGKLRSVLVCRKCGNKRTQSEPFMSLSLPLSKEVQQATANLSTDEYPSRVKISVERCLQHFTMPESLTDPVDCPSCHEKTLTTKQHVISKLPKILCLHLKRFDAAGNKKIEDFVSFPAKELNMGLFLPHWCEVTKGTESATDEGGIATPSILYDLFGTVNHFGNLQSGHYVANVKVDSMWYHCNDQHVVFAGEGNGEKEVMNSDGAYLLFYIRSDSSQ